MDKNYTLLIDGLKFYSDSDNYNDNYDENNNEKSKIDLDRGHLARYILKTINELTSFNDRLIELTEELGKASDETKRLELIRKIGELNNIVNI